MKKAFLFVVMALVLSVTRSAGAESFIVTDEAELRSTLRIAENNGEYDYIEIAPGTYYTSGCFFIYNPWPGENYPIHIAGAYVADPSAVRPILDGGGLDQVMRIDTTGLTDDSNVHVSVGMLIFQNGNGSPDGGGLCTITSEADITVSYCQFGGNTAYEDGGGLYAESDSGDVSVYESTFSGNTAGSGADGDGGGAKCVSNSGSVKYQNNTFNGNISGDGGGAYGISNSLKVEYYGNIFDGNTAVSVSGGAYGGSYSGLVTYLGNTFKDNGAFFSGGAFGTSYSEDVRFVNNIFYGNSAYDGAGAIGESTSGGLTFTNNTFSGNNAGAGGGGGFTIFLRGDFATADIYNNIAWNNYAPHEGKDIMVHDDAEGGGIGATVNLYNNDYGPGTDDFYIDYGDHLFEGNNIHTNPLFVNPTAGDFHLQPGSLCIDAGLNSAPHLMGVDFEGHGRIIDGDNDGTATVDIGADEYVLYSAIILTAPNGGEAIPSGSTYSIRWGAPPGAVSFKLKYSMDKGKTWKPIASGITDMSYDWPVPTPPSNKTKCLVKVLGYDAGGKKLGADSSNGNFAIEVVRVSWPRAGHHLISGRTYPIAWTTSEAKKPVAKVILKYTKNGGNTWNKIVTLDGNPGSYHDWTVPNVPKTKIKCKVKVVLKDARGNTVGSDTSDSSFTIEPTP